MRSVSRNDTIIPLDRRADTVRPVPEPFGHQRLVAPGDVLAVHKGFVDLFWVETQAGIAHGARRHIMRIEPGGSIFGTAPVTLPDGLSGAVLSVGGLETEIVAQRLDDLLATGGTEVAAAIDAWIDGLSRAAWPRPLSDRSTVALPEKRIELAPGAVTRAGPRCVVWLCATDGVLLREGAESAEAVETVLPVTELIGATAGTAAVVECHGTETVLQVRGGIEIADAIESLGDLALRSLAVRLVETDRDAAARRLTGGHKAEQQFLADLSQLAVAAGSRRGAALQTAKGADAAAVEAVGLVAERLGIATPGGFRQPDGSATAIEQVMQVAEAANIRHRRVMLRGGWPHRDHGALIGFRGDERTPVALLPTRSGEYRLVDPADGTDQPVGKVIGELSGEAVALYRPLPPGRLSLRRLMAFSFFGSAQDAGALLFSSLVIGLLALFGPFATGLLFDTIVPDAERSLLLQVTAGLVVAALGATLFEVARAVALARMESRIEWMVQAAVTDRLLGLPASFFKSYSSGDLADRLLGFDAIRHALTGSAVTSLVAIVFSLFNFVLLFIIDPRLAVIAVALIGVSIAATVGISLVQLRHQRARVERRGKLNGFVNQLVIGVRKLRVAARERRAAGVWARDAARVTAHAIKSRRCEAWLQVMTEAFPIIATALIFLSVIALTSDNGLPGRALSTGRYLAFSAAFGQLLAALSTLALSLTQSLMAIPLYERARPILTAEPEEREPSGAPLHLHGGIEVERLTFRYGSNEPCILEDVSFAVRPGEFVAVVGRSGSGKSTLLRLLLGFEKAESGTVLFDGRPIEHLDLAGVRRDMGVVLQNGKLSPGSIYDNIVGQTGLSIDDAWETARLVGLDDDIKAMPMGMHTVLMEGAQTLSGGQRQRLMIARALVRRPRILLLDEATSALDNRTQAIVTASLAQLNITRLVIAHRLSTIQAADQIIVLDRGRIVESGSFPVLMAKAGVFAALANRQLL